MMGWSFRLRNLSLTQGVTRECRPLAFSRWLATNWLSFHSADVGTKQRRGGRSFRVQLLATTNHSSVQDLVLA